MSTPGELLEALGREARARFSGGGVGGARLFRGRSVEELVPQIQRELGPDAIIVRRREGLTGGVLGFFQRTYVEIEATPGAPAVDLYDEQHQAEPEPLAPGGGAGVAGAPGGGAGAAGAEPAQPALLGPGPAQPPAAAGAQDAAGGYAPPGAPAPAQPYLAGAYAPPAAPAQPTAPAGAPAPAPASAPTPAERPPGSTEHLRPALGYWPGAAGPAAAAPAEPAQPAPAPAEPAPAAPAPPAPAPFPPRESYSAPPAGEGSTYVTARLAALARANRPRPASAVAGAPLEPFAPVPPSGEPATPRAAQARTLQGTGEPAPWSSDFQELSARAAQELTAPPRVERPPPAPAPSELRVVAAGSHARARAGVTRSLQRYGISAQLAEELIDAASAHALALAPRAGMAQAVRATLAQRIPVAPPLPAGGAAIVMVGAGGAGKTTCCAALLGAYRRSSSLAASFATVTREAEQLRVLLSPHLVKPTPARTPRALRALRRARQDGLAVIDTPSLSPSDRAGVRELASLLGELKPERVVVALPATLGPAAASQLLAALKPLGANSLAVTHADETDQIGVAVEAACRFELAPEYVLDRSRGGWRLSRVDPAGLAARLLQ